MRSVFLILGDQTRSGVSEFATHDGRVLVATTPEEVQEVPGSWIPVDLDAGLGLRLDADTISVTEWLGTVRGDS